MTFLVNEMDTMEDQAILTVLNVFIGDLDRSTNRYKRTNAPLDVNYMTCCVLDFRTKACSIVTLHFLITLLYWFALCFVYIISSRISVLWNDTKKHKASAPGDFKQAPLSFFTKKTYYCKSRGGIMVQYVEVH